MSLYPDQLDQKDQKLQNSLLYEIYKILFKNKKWLFDLIDRIDSKSLASILWSINLLVSSLSLNESIFKINNWNQLQNEITTSESSVITIQ